MKVCIIGFDSLDYNLIKKYNLKNIKQKQFGEIKIEGILSTPTIWTSFLTGLPPDKHKIIGWKWENPLLNKVKIMATKIGIKKIIDENIFLTKMFNKVPKQTPNIKGILSTFFDYAERPIDIDIPCYGEDTYKEIRHEVIEALGNPLLEKKLAEKTWKNFYIKREKILNLLKKDWDIFMAHIYISDVIQHIQFYRNKAILNLYKEMDHTAYLVKEIINEDAFILFISDHGQKNGIHNPNAFYSTNKNIHTSIQNINDFYEIILNELGIPTKSDLEIIKNRLEKLGYI